MSGNRVNTPDVNNPKRNHENQGKESFTVIVLVQLLAIVLQVLIQSTHIHINLDLHAGAADTAEERMLRRDRLVVSRYLPTRFHQSVVPGRAAANQIQPNHSVTQNRTDGGITQP